MRFEVKFYETTDGKKPVEDFLLSLENKMQAKMVQKKRGPTCVNLTQSLWAMVFLS